jgi:hypothetical protein
MERRKDLSAGPVSATPCPWCGQRNDLSELWDQGVLEEGEVVDPTTGRKNRGSKVDCDHCQRISVVVKIDRAPRVVLKQFHG